MLPCALRFLAQDFVCRCILRRLKRTSVTQFLVALALVCSCGLPALGQFVGYVPNTTSNSVSIFGTQLTTQAAPLGNSNTDNVIQTLDGTTGWKAPVRVAVLGDIRTDIALQPYSTAFVTSQGDNGLWAINTLKQLATRSATATDLNVGANPLKLNQPGGIAIASSSTVIAAYIANQGDGTVSIVNVDPSSAAQNTLIANLPTVSPAASSSTIPEVAAAGEFIFVMENSPSASLWFINTSSASQATQVVLPQGTGKLTALNAFQLTDSSSVSHTFVALTDSTNGTVIVIDATIPQEPLPTIVTLGSGASPVTLVSAFDVSLGTQGIQAIYVADTSTGFPIWYFDVDCSSTSCRIPSSVSTPLTNANAAPTSIGITPDGQQLFFTESSGQGIQNFCVATCTNPDNSSDTTVGTGSTGVIVADISTGSAPLCWFTGGGMPQSSATAVPSSACNNLSCVQGAPQSALGACAQSRNLKGATITLNFEDKFGCVAFGSDGNPSPACSAQGGLGGQTLYDVTGVFTTVISQTNPAGTGSISAQTRVMSDVNITSEPANQTINGGSTATLNVVASSIYNSIIKYQWYQVTSSGNTAISGATASSYTTPPLSVSSSYFVQLDDGTGPLPSNTATITILAPMIAIPPASTTVNAGQSLVYTISVNSGSTPVNLSCQPQPPNQSLPAGVHCLFSPTQISAGQTSQLIIATTGPIALLERNGSAGMFYGVMFLAPFFGLLMTMPCRRSLKRSRFFLLIYPSLFLLLLIGCGTDPKPVPTSPNAVTPPGVYTVLVVGTNAQNQVVASTQVSFTVH